MHILICVYTYACVFMCISHLWKWGTWIPSSAVYLPIWSISPWGSQLPIFPTSNVPFPQPPLCCGFWYSAQGQCVDAFRFPLFSAGLVFLLPLFVLFCYALPTGFWTKLFKEEMREEGRGRNIYLFTNLKPL
jgi:hypothetical protein